MKSAEQLSEQMRRWLTDRPVKEEIRCKLEVFFAQNSNVTEKILAQIPIVAG
jgi:hypothetical protein